MTKLTGALGILLFVSFLTSILLSSESSFIKGLENRTWDFRVLLTANKNLADKRIKIIEIDQATLNYFEKEYSLTWPFPRNIYNHIVTYLTEAGAKGLAFDLLFTESSAQAAEADLDFAKATSGKLAVVSAVVLNSKNESIDLTKFAAFSERQLKVRYSSDLLVNAKDFPSITLPIPELIKFSSAMGNVQANPDSDGVFRHHSPVGVVNGVPVLSLPFALYQITGNQLAATSPETLTVKLHGGSGVYNSYSLAEIIQSQVALEQGLKPAVDPSIFKDSLVLFGTTAPGLLDLRPTSLEERGSGISFNAAVLDNLLNNNFVETVSKNTMLVLTIGLVALTLVATLSGPKLSLHLLRVLAIVLVFLSAAVFLAFKGIWLSVLVPFVAITLTAFLGVALQYKLEGRLQRFIRSAFKYYVSASVVEEIVSNPSKLSLGGQKREATILFSDIVGFTSISEKLEPQTLVKMLNDYLTLFTDIIQSSGGTVDKYVGDAVMAFWNAPLECPEHAKSAVEAAIKCQKKLATMQPYFEERYGIFPDTRIGIHTDLVIVGNFGSRDRFNYTAIGDGVNLASRLEGANKNFGTKILISEKTMAQLPQTLLSRRLADLVVVGKSNAIRVFEPYYGQSYFDTEKPSLFDKALEDLEQGMIQSAISIFSSLTTDPAAGKYLLKLKASSDDASSAILWNLVEK